MAEPVADRWAVGDDYEAYVGRWSRRVARELVDGLGIPPGRRWLDVGCGTGALGQTVLARCSPDGVMEVDRSASFVGHARRHTRDPRAVHVVADACALPLADAAFDVAVSGLVLNFVPEPAAAVAHMRRAVRPLTGVVAAYVWDYAGGMQLMRLFWDAAVALDPAARDLDEGRRFPLCRPEPLRALFGAAGLVEVAVQAIDVPTVFASFDDCWSPFLGGQGPAPSYCVSLAAERRDALRERLRSLLPIEGDGRIALSARAWAVRGRRP